jgi:hypothetical protein
VNRKENDFWNANKGKYHKSLRKDVKNEERNGIRDNNKDKTKEISNRHKKE